MRAAALLDAARSLVDRTEPDAPWPRAVALLTRQALEEHVAEVLTGAPASDSRTPMTAQLLWYRAIVDDPARAERLAAAWAGLSEACHVHGYELAPSADALRAWIDVVAAAVRTS